MFNQSARFSDDASGFVISNNCLVSRPSEGKQYAQLICALSTLMHEGARMLRHCLDLSPPNERDGPEVCALFDTRKCVHALTPLGKIGLSDVFKLRTRSLVSCSLSQQTRRSVGLQASY